MKKLLTLFIFLSVILLNAPSANAVSSNDTESKAYILIDAKTGQVIAEHNADITWRPASLTKIMTAIVALENGKPDQIMTASAPAVYDIGDGGSNVGIMPGEEMRMDELLNALMIRSANESANIIAENLYPTRQAFIDQMNIRAKELGATNTTFVNTCGKDNSKEDAAHFSTARDIMKMAQYAMTIPEFRKIVSKEYMNLQPTNKHPKWDILRNTNRFLWGGSNYTFTDTLGEKKDFNIIGVKTGYTGNAGNNLVTCATNTDGMELLVVMLGVRSQVQNKIYKETKELLEYGFSNFSMQQLVGANEKIESVKVEDAKDEASLDLLTASELRSVLPIDKSEWNLAVSKNIKNNIQAPVSQGEVLGYVEYSRNGVSLGKVDIIAASTIEKSVQAKTLDTAKSVFLNPVFKKASITLLSVLVLFVLLKFCLRRISRAYSAKKT